MKWMKRITKKKIKNDIGKEITTHDIDRKHRLEKYKLG